MAEPDNFRVSEVAFVNEDDVRGIHGGILAAANPTQLEAYEVLITDGWSKDAAVAKLATWIAAEVGLAMVHGDEREE